MPFTPFKKKTDKDTKGKDTKAKAAKPWEKKVASQAEINVFVKAAMARYAELGVPKDIAEELFARKMTKIAEQLGMALPQDPSQRIVKLATAKLTAKGIPEAQAQVMLTHEFSKQAFIEKVARVKKAVMNHVKKAQTAPMTPVASKPAMPASPFDPNRAGGRAAGTGYPSTVAGQRQKQKDEAALKQQ